MVASPAGDQKNAYRHSRIDIRDIEFEDVQNDCKASRPLTSTCVSCPLDNEKEAALMASVILDVDGNSLAGGELD